MLQIHQKIAQARIAAGYTQDQFAEILGIKRSTYQYWEEKTPGVDKIAKIAKALKLPLEHFLNAESTSKKAKRDEPETDDLAIETIRDLARSSVILAESNKVLADNNKELIVMFKATADVRLKNQSTETVGEMLAPYLYKMANAGIGQKFWKSVDEGLIALGKLLVEDVPAMQK